MSVRMLLILVFSVLLFELPFSAQAAWSDWQITRQADRLELSSRAILPFRQSIKNYFTGQTHWFSDMHGQGCQQGTLYLWSYRANHWEKSDNGNFDAWCR